MNRYFTKSLRILPAASLLVVFGCSSHIEFNDKVEGTVKLDGAPLANVLVEFVPNLKSRDQAPMSRATTDATGHFTLMCSNERPGAVVGKHNVLVRTGRGGRAGADEMDAPPADGNTAGGRPVIPGEYASAAKTPIKIDVTADKHSYEINVQSFAASQQGGGSANNKD
jgi:hypothetical protein